MKLHPIETAPMDGQIVVLAAIDDECVMVREARWEESTGKWTWPWICDITPKFWMPVPELPESQPSEA